MIMREKTFYVGTALVFGLILIVAFAGIAAATVTVEGDFTGTMVGYGDDANTDAEEFPNAIAVEGEITVEGEDIVKPEIIVESGESTVLDTSSVELRVPGEQAVPFDSEYRPDTVVQRADEMPAGTTIDIFFTVYFKGETEDEIESDTINAANIQIEYETQGETPEEESFNVETDVSPRAENEISSLRGETTIPLWQEILSYVGAALLALIILYSGWYLIAGRKKDPKQGKGSP